MKRLFLASLASLGPALLIAASGSAPAKAITITPCTSNPSYVCGATGIIYNGESLTAELIAGLAEDAYGASGQFLDVKTEAEATALMDASASQLNAYALTVPNNPTTPPVLFGDTGNTLFDIAYNYQYDPILGKWVWNASRSRWEWVDSILRWQIQPTLVTIPADQSSTWIKVPGPLPLAGAGVAFGFSRRLRQRIRLTPMG